MKNPQKGNAASQEIAVALSLRFMAVTSRKASVCRRCWQRRPV